MESEFPKSSDFVLGWLGVVTLLLGHKYNSHTFLISIKTCGLVRCDC